MQLYTLTIFLPIILGALPYWRRFPLYGSKSLTPGKRKLVLTVNGTLVPNKTGLQDLYGKAIRAYCQEVLGMKESDIGWKTYGYVTEYGSIPNGLVKEYEINPGDYEAFLDKNIDYECIHHDQALVNMLEQLSANFDIVIFTDANPLHTKRVLTKLGIMELVRAISPSVPGEIEFPLRETSTGDAFVRVESLLDVAPDRIYYVDGSLDRYLYMAKDRNWNPIRIDEYCRAGICARPDFPTISSIHELSGLLKDLVITPEKE